MSSEKIEPQPSSVTKNEGPTTRSGFSWSLIMGAAFLMATSAVGPGFLTQTTVFTQTLGASFGVCYPYFHHLRYRRTA
ncbi:hypothetical protein [Aliivibrio wodanis]|uniref:hypothetical protein n=1 Tax=Aliivibrio wodanis TaxID=80852 RepID=UPI00406C1784